MRTVMRLGDSLTVGYATMDGGAFAAQWTARRELFAFTGTVASVTGPHEGHGGFSTRQVFDKLDGWIAATHPTDVVVVLGTNDAAWGGATAAAAIGNLEAILRKLAKSGARVTVGTVPDVIGPGTKTMGGAVAWIPAYNEQIAKLVTRLRAEGIDVRRADLDKAINDPSLYAADGIHLNAKGYAIMGATLGRVSAAPEIEPMKGDAGVVVVAVLVFALLLLKR